MSFSSSCSSLGTGPLHVPFTRALLGRTPFLQSRPQQCQSFVIQSGGHHRENFRRHHQKVFPDHESTNQPHSALQGGYVCVTRGVPPYFPPRTQTRNLPCSAEKYIFRPLDQPTNLVMMSEIFSVVASCKDKDLPSRRLSDFFC